MRRIWDKPTPPRSDQLDLAQPIDWSHPQARGLVAYFPFFLLRAGVKARDLAYGIWPADLTAGAAYVADGPFGAAVDFSGGADDRVVPSGAILTAPPITMACWATCTNISVTQTLMCLSSTSPNQHGYELLCNGAASGDPIQAASRAGLGNFASSATPAYPSTRYFHACGTWGSNVNRTAYLDGVAAATNTNYISPSTPNVTGIGCLYYTSWAYGVYDRIAEARFYNRVLTSAEVYNLWHPSRRWEMLRTLTERTTVVVPASGPGRWPWQMRRQRRMRGAA